MTTMHQRLGAIARALRSVIIQMMPSWGGRLIIACNLAQQQLELSLSHSCAPQPSYIHIDYDVLVGQDLHVAARRVIHQFRRREVVLERLTSNSQPVLGMQLCPELWEIVEVVSVVSSKPQDIRNWFVPCRLHYRGGVAFGTATFHVTAIRTEYASGGQYPIQNTPSGIEEMDLHHLFRLSTSDGPFETVSIEGFDGDWVVYIVPYNA